MQINLFCCPDCEKSSEAAASHYWAIGDRNDVIPLVHEPEFLAWTELT